MRILIQCKECGFSIKNATITTLEFKENLKGKVILKFIVQCNTCKTKYKIWGCPKTLFYKTKFNKNWDCNPECDIDE